MAGPHDQSAHGKRRGLFCARRTRRGAWLRAGLQSSLWLLGVAAGFREPALGDGPAAAQPSGGGQRITGLPFASRSEVIARHGMAATSQPLATQAALDILKAGGSAVDAAIAANAMLGVVEPTGCGIGGDLFVIGWDAASGRLYGLNASGRSPQALTLEHLRQQGLKQIPDYGPLPVSVPGCVDGWFELHRRYGRLSMEQILAPAIRCAREGFPVTELIAHYWKEGGAKLGGYPNFQGTYLPDGGAPAKGDLFRNPGLARTYEQLAGGGRDAFYRGEIARTIDAFCRRVGCFLRYEDLAGHASEWVEPAGIAYRGHQVWELPPNGQGLTVLQMLSLLEGFDLRSLGHNTAPCLHLMIEAKKLAFEDRARYYADPAFARSPVAALISDSYTAQRRALIRPDRASQEISAGAPQLSAGDTICLSVADAERNMVSLIQSNYRGFGSGLVPDGLGFCLQDRGALFALQDGHPNVYAPGKRPFHTIIPGFVTRGGRPVLAFGLMGGDMQPQGHVQVLSNIFDFGMNVQEAGDAARWYHAGSSTPTGLDRRGGGTVSVEPGVPAATVQGLKNLGHDLGSEHGIFGGYQAIWYDAQRGVYIGGSDLRKDGCAAGY